MATREEKIQGLSRKLTARFPELTLDHDLAGEPMLRVPADKYLETVAALRNEPEFQFTILVQIYGAHYPDDDAPFEAVALLSSLHLGAHLPVKVRAQGTPPTVPSLAMVWPAANWHERETYDMYGIHFDGHPDLRRIFLSDDADFHPLRKEFPTAGFED